MNKNADNHAYHGGESEGFYSRWSKRKVQERSTQKADFHSQSQSARDINSSLDTSVDKQLLTESNQEKKLLCDEDMPDLDSLDEDSDYSGFLSPGVSEKLRQLALRKLFQGQSFNLCDGLDDYDEEFTSFEKLGDIVTADMRFQMEEEAKRKLQLASESDDIADESNEVVMLDKVDSEIGAEKEINESILAPVVDEAADMAEDDRKLLASKKPLADKKPLASKKCTEENNLRDNETLS